MELWAMDEHRLGLKPVLRRVWAERGERPVVKVRHRYEWLYVYGFARPATGETFRLLMPSVDAGAFGEALSRFAREAGAGPGRRVLLVLDGAGYHSSRKVVAPEGIELVFLPPRSRELQPAERLRGLTDEAVADRLSDTLDELEEALSARCVTLAGKPELIRSHTLLHRWPKAA